LITGRRLPLPNGDGAAVSDSLVRAVSHRSNSQIPSCLCHLTLPQFGQQHIICREFSTPVADDILLKHRPHVVVRQRYLANIAVELSLALRALKIDGHDAILPFLDCQRLVAQRGPQAAVRWSDLLVIKSTTSIQD
jgi:hypothetical protein